MKILPERDPPGLAATSLDAPSLASKANDSFVVLQNNYANGKRLAPRFVRASTHFESMTTLDGGHREISISDRVALIECRLPLDHTSNERSNSKRFFGVMVVTTPRCVIAVRPSSKPISSMILPSMTLRTVVPVKRILWPLAAGRLPMRKSLKAGPVCVPPPSYWPTT